MANILYHSVHEILEYDEMLILADLGHTVFSLGTYSPTGAGEPGWRPWPKVAGDLQPFIEAYQKAGKQLTREFVDLFDVVLVMHELEFIEKNWDVIKAKKVVWRTIGQGINEGAAKKYRNEGLIVLGWSAFEAFGHGYDGRDAFIYAYKDPSVYGPWTGKDRTVLTFSNAYRQRYPIELEFFLESVNGLPVKLGGGMNDDLPYCIGLVDFEDQIEMYARCGAYFYCHGTSVPYTLNFIEALMSGAPIVAIGPNAGLNAECNEIIQMLEDGVNGFVVNTPQEAYSTLRTLLDSKDLAQRVSHGARKLAVEKFGKDAALTAWGQFFTQIGIAPPKS